MADQSGRVLGAAALALGLVVSTVVGGRALERARHDDTIQVTGSAKRRIRSDLITWTARITTRADALPAAYKALKPQSDRVVDYLVKKGIPRPAITLTSVDTTVVQKRDKEGNQIDEVAGYVLAQSFEVRSGEVDKVAQISREATELIDEGLVIESQAPEYHYTKIGDLKIQMLSEAAKDSRVRAEQIASSTGAKLGVLRSARMGVIQINPADSTEVSNEGNNDTSSLEKDIITVVASTFALE